MDQTVDRSCLQLQDGRLLESGPNELILRNAATGKTEWTYQRDGMSCGLLTKDTVYVAADADKLIALDRSSGKEKWAFTTPTKFPRRAGPRPTVTPSVVHALYDGKILSVSLTTRKELWRRDETADISVTNTVPAADTLLTVTANGKLCVLSAATGKELWTHATESAGIIEAVPTVLDNVVYFGSGDRHVYAVDLQSRKTRWTAKLDHPTTWPVVHIDDRLFIPDGSHLHGLDRTTGKQAWKVASEDHGHTLAGPKQFLYTRPRAQQVRSLDPETGDIFWTLAKMPDPEIAADNDHLYVSTPTSIKAFKLKTP
ncbi:PQQ-binding-like beta-propeller repeat protein [Streptomyces sp. NPDC056437]|uniref:PQQ-like beta-propeller repeat protein n=1 Tax=Streptomyces sp. NPDC056437 TaxID=3345816 RepID=UPI0036CDEC23